MTEERAAGKAASESFRAVAASRYLLRALAHKLRTPLSVVSNDLAYFKILQNQLQQGATPQAQKSEEFDRSLQKCREISEILRAAQMPLELSQHRRVVQLPAELLALKGFTLSTSESCELIASPEQLSFIFGALASLATTVPGILEVQTPTLLLNDQRAVINYGTLTSGVAVIEKRSYSALSEFATTALGVDVPLLAVIDLVVFGCGYEISIHQSDTLELTISFVP